MRFSHGSSSDIQDGDFDVFNYTIDTRTSGSPMTNPHIDNGNDAEGIGIYAFIGDSQEAQDSAAHYTSEESSFIYVLEVDLDDEDLMNNREPDEIPVYDLASVVKSFITEIRHQNKFSLMDFKVIINSFENSFDDSSIEDVNNKLKNLGHKMILDSYSDPKNFDNFDDWKYQVMEDYYVNEPCSHICDEGTPEQIAEYAINSSDNLWETIKHLGQTLAISYTGKGTIKHNKVFQKTVLNNLPEYNLVAAHVDNGNFAVIFDTDAIKLVSKKDLNLKFELEHNKDIEKPQPKKIKYR